MLEQQDDHVRACDVTIQRQNDGHKKWRDSKLPYAAHFHEMVLKRQQIGRRRRRYLLHPATRSLPHCIGSSLPETVVWLRERKWPPQRRPLPKLHKSGFL